MSPYVNDASYTGANDGRKVFETLSESYIVLSLFNALQLHDEGPTFYTFAAYVVGCSDAVREVLQYLYPSSLSVQDKDPAWSPDGGRIAFTSNRDGNWEIYLVDADLTNPTRLTYNNADDLDPAWSPNGQMIAFASNRTGDFEIYTVRADGTNLTQLTTNTSSPICSDEIPDSKRNPTWSPNGQQIAFTGKEGHTEPHSDPCRTNIYCIDSDGSTLSIRLTNDLFGNSEDLYPN